MELNKTREECYELLRKYNKTESLVKHALSVEGVMRHFARIYGENEKVWGCVGLLHDLDYEQYPEQHCKKCVEILKEEGFPDDFIHAVVSHGYGLCADVEPQSNLEKVLYTIDELTGLLTACVYMRPSKSILDLEYSSVKKKYKSPNFAAGVNRGVIENGCNMLGKDLQYIIEQTILGMREVAEEIGLKGNL